MTIYTQIIDLKSNTHRSSGGGGVVLNLVQPTKTIQVRHEKLNECKCQR